MGVTGISPAIIAVAMRSTGRVGGGGSGGDDGGGCFGWLVAALFGLLAAGVLIGAFVLMLYTVDKSTEIAMRPAIEAKCAKLNQFLVDHGETVTMIGMQDEFKDVRQGKQMVTRGDVWLRCRFKDGYVIEVPQRHDDPTARVPMEGEVWRLAVRNNNYRAWFELTEKVD